MAKTFNPALKGDGELVARIYERMMGEEPGRGERARAERADALRKELMAARYEEWLAAKLKGRPAPTALGDNARPGRRRTVPAAGPQGLKESK